MSVKEDALNQSAQNIFNNGQTLRLIFCDGTWNETTSTKLDIYPTEIAVPRPEIPFSSAVFDGNTNAITVTLINNSYISATDFTFNRVAVVADGKLIGSFPILSISGNVVTLDGTPADWIVGETVYTSSGEYVIQNISGSQITLDATPTGDKLVNGTGSLLAALEIGSKIFTANTTNQLELEIVLSGN